MMEASSWGLLFGCFGAISVFCGSKYYMQRHWDSKMNIEKTENVTGEAATKAVIEASYERLALLRVMTFLLSLTAVGLWFLEPKPYVAGVIAALACFCLWWAWLLREKILKLLWEKRNVNS